MKRLISLAFLISVVYSVGFGQASSSQNYVMTNTVKVANIKSEDLVAGLPIATQGKSQTIAYFDGLGRPLQTVIREGSATQKDIIAGSEYDAYGREVKKYLPYADINNTAYPGSYKLTWQTTQASFYNGQLAGVDADAAPYSQALLEASPLNRLLAQGAPGTVWQPDVANNNPYNNAKKIIQVNYEINTAADNVRIFNVDNTNGNISSPGTYASGLLTVKKSTDEHGGIVKEFTDKSGQMLLKQVYIENDVLQTYYIYNDLDLLRAVIQPEGVAAIPTSGTWSPDAKFTSNWMFLYSYDKRNRMVTKQVPGAGAVYMIYDIWDRLVLTQDANQRSGSTKYWLFTKYDALNRPVVSGQLADSRAQSVIQAEVDGKTVRFETVSTGSTEGYTLNNSFPSSGTYTLTVYTTTHYDSYTGLPSWGSGYSFVSENGVTTKNDNLQGQIVATQTRILNTSNFLRSVVYYDDKYKTIQSTADNSAGGKDRVTRVLSFDGKPMQEYQTHTSNVYTTALVTKKAYTYDHADRVKTITHKIGTGEEITMAENAYNEMGQLLNKKLHQSTTFTTPLQKLDYAYNIRGWLNGINKPVSGTTGYDETDLFNFELHYNTTSLGGIAAYNGNISEQVWKGGYDEYLRAYKYTYDKANRLKTSDYGFKYLNSINVMDWDFTMKYNESITPYTDNLGYHTAYDRNGNINHLERFHGTWQRVDDLKYDYKNSNTDNLPDGNRLHKVIENQFVSPPVGFKDKDNWFNDYNYDANGNLTNDYNKDIGNIQYNHLNLPTLVDFGTAKGTIAYVYDAGGNKLQKTVTDKTVSPNKISITKYAGPFVYTNSYLSGQSVPAETLEFIGHEEGRIRPAKIDPAQPLTAGNTKYIYDYFMKDHLGNTRMVLTTEQQTDLYAATLEPANTGTENGLFNNIVPVDKPNNTTTGVRFDDNASNSKVVKLNGGTASTRVGPGITLKVMAGDIISISTKGWYKDNSTATVPGGLGSLQPQLLDLLTAGITGNGGTHGGAVLETDIRNASSGVLNDFLTNNQPTNYNSAQPKAFLNWIIVDEEFKKVSSSFHMGAVQIPSMTSEDVAKTLVGPLNMTVRRGGWLYVYVSNESNQDVYFDDLVINHKRGPVVEASNYYAFGLEIPGLGSKAIGFGGSNDNRIKYNGKELQSKEFSDGGGLTWEDYGARMYDPQIGRWMVVDPLADKYVAHTPYNYTFNDPLNHIDPNGMSANWVPAVSEKKDANGNVTSAQITVVKEKGDDAKSLATFLGVDQKTADKLYSNIDKKGEIALTNEVPGVEQINAYLGDVVNYPGNYSDIISNRSNYNCFECAITVSQGASPDFSNVMSSSTFKQAIKDDYVDVGNDPSKFKFGQTVIRFRDRSFHLAQFSTLSLSTHAAIYLGASRDGTQYAWSKGGSFPAPKVEKVNDLIKEYGGIDGYGKEVNSGGYFNKK